jgi:hypothetical protein
VLTDGRVLLAGGWGAEAALVDQAERSDPRTARGSVTARVGTPRAQHTAVLQVDGTVLLWGGVGQDSTEILTGEVYDPEPGTFALLATAPPDTAVVSLAVAGSHPADGADAVPTDVGIGIRVTRPLRVETVTPSTVFLVGPAGLEAARVVAAEGGRLVFVTPETALQPGAAYTVTLNGPTDPVGTALPFTTLVFTTADLADVAGPPSGSAPPAAAPAPSADAADPAGAEGLAPGASPAGVAPEATLPPLAAGPGVTALAGRVLTLDGQPLPRVTLQIDAQRTQTDATGRFVLAVDPAGWHELLIDGRSASRPGRTYGVFEVGVELIAGRTTALPYTIWMPALDMAHTVRIPSPTTTEVVVTTPGIPGLELRLPPGTVIWDHEGRITRDISITPLRRDRPPFPLPANVDTPVYFTIQPGAGYVTSPNGAGARLIYPNGYHWAPGARADFWHYEPGPRGWYIYGQGTVTADGTQVIPDAGSRSTSSRGR